MKKEEIIEVTSGKMSDELYNKLSKGKKDRNKIEEYYNEFNLKDRDIRDSQIGKTLKNKKIGTGEKMKIKIPVRIPASFQNKIVNTSVAFEFAEPVKLLPSEENELSEEVKRIWDVNRMDSKLQKLKIIQRSQTQAALIFFIKKVESDKAINVDLGVNTNNQIKCRILDYKSGNFFPVFDQYRDMKLFVFEFNTNYDESIHVWVYDEKHIHKYERKGSVWTYAREAHGFSKIPVVYLSQDEPEYYGVKEIIDRLETSCSKLGNSNDYSGHPILFTVGEIKGMPDKDEEGKMINAPIKKASGPNGKPQHGDAKFLTHDNAPDSVKLEMETLENWAYSLSSTPNISFNNLKGIGNVSGVALKLMFLDSILKAKMNEGDNKTDIQRIINVIISGIITSIKQDYSSMATSMIYDVKFGDVLPNDLADVVSTLVEAVEGKVLSRERAIELLSIVENASEEMEKIENESQKTENKQLNNK